MSDLEDTAQTVGDAARSAAGIGPDPDGAESLSEAAQGYDIADNEAERGLIRELFLPLRNLFIWLNVLIFAGVAILVVREEYLHRPIADRLVDGQVLAVLIGATAAQLGAIIIASMRDLMKRGSSGA